MQSFVFCIRADGSAFVGDLGELCAGWLCAMHRAEEPTPGIWERVPSELLPDGAAIAYFNAGAFFEDVVRPSFSERPARMSNAEGAVMAMVQEFIDTGAQRRSARSSPCSAATLRQGIHTQRLGPMAHSPMAPLETRAVITRPSSLDVGGVWAIENRT